MPHAVCCMSSPSRCCCIFWFVSVAYYRGTATKNLILVVLYTARFKLIMASVAVYGLYRHVAVNGTACYCSTILFTQFCPTRTSLDRLLCRVSTLLLLVTLDYGDILYCLLFSNGFITHYRGTAAQIYVSSLHLLGLLLLFWKGGRNVGILIKGNFVKSRDSPYPVLLLPCALCTSTHVHVISTWYMSVLYLCASTRAIVFLCLALWQS